MTESLQDIFGEPVEADPRVALPAGVLGVNPKPGPLHRVEYVIEFVGPKSIPAYAGSRVLDYDWYGALGNPRVWAMRPGDTQWQTLVPSRDGSYDSLALSWPVFSPTGSLGTMRARELSDLSTQFAYAIERKVATIPPPGDIDALARDLADIYNGLDIGVSVAFVPSRGWVSERDLWKSCVALGLQYNPNGAFAWMPRTGDQPLFEITPIGNTESFSLGAVKMDDRHEGATLGFSIPLSPNPHRAIEGLLRAGRYLCETIGGRLVDDSDRFVDSGMATTMINEVVQAVDLLNKAKVAPGSSEARLLFTA